MRWNQRPLRGLAPTGRLVWMRAVTIAGPGRLEIAERPLPVASSNRVVVRVRAAGLNRADLLQAAGHYPPPPGWPPDIPGLEFAGEVVEVGPEVTMWKPGDRVFGLCGGGAQAEFMAVPEGHCAAIPPGLDDVEAGAVPEAFITAHDALVSQAGLAAGERVLIHAVGSGVGTAAVQISRALGGRVFGTARTESKLHQAESLGMEQGILTGRDDTEAMLAARMEPLAGTIDVVLNLIGARYLQADLTAAAVKGRIVVLATMAGALAEVDLRLLMSRRLALRGSVLRPRPEAEKDAAVAAFERDLAGELGSRRIRPVVADAMPFEAAARAYQLLASDTVFGKLVLTF